MARRVTAPDGRRWVVRRRWLPWRPRWRGAPRELGHIVELLDVGDLGGCGVALLDNIAAVLLFVGGAVLVVLFVIPALIALAELGVLLVLLVAGAVGRVVLHRPWLVDAVPADGDGARTWRVLGWRRSDEVAVEVAANLRAGLDPHPSGAIGGS